MDGSLAFGVGAAVATKHPGGLLGTVRPARYRPSSEPAGKPPPDRRTGRLGHSIGRQPRAMALPAGGPPAPPRPPLAPRPRGATPTSIAAAAAASDTSPGPPPAVRDVMAEARDMLRSRFGHRDFAPGQEQVIRTLLTGRHGGSALAVLPTGGGKSLCYQLPALLLRDGITLVVVPTVSLLEDQLRRLRAACIPALRVTASTPDREWRAIVGAGTAGDPPVLLTTPESVRGLSRDRLQLLPVALMVVDEVHCVLEWGPSFRPDYLQLSHVASKVRAARVLGLTATASVEDAAKIVAHFGIAPEAIVRTSFRRPNLLTTVVELPPTAPRLSGDKAVTAPLARRLQRLKDLLRDEDRGPTLVYANTRRQADWLAFKLRDVGLPAASYHAGLPSVTRSDVHNWFHDTPDGIVACTCAFGMGIDKKDVRVRTGEKELGRAVGARMGE